ncbi:MAG: hypothetical protein E6I91_16365 [Chloroflexi bacterium]|nr:MAG: hypothetical protein E6I91_16365 [Chloroflexota bacterium]
MTGRVRCALLVPSAHHNPSSGARFNNGRSLDKGREQGGKQDHLWGWRRLSTCTPGGSGVVSRRAGQQVCPHLVTGEPSSSCTANMSLQEAFQEEVATSDLGGRWPKGGNHLGSNPEGKRGPPGPVLAP